MEPRDHGVEHEADVRPGRGELSLNSTFCVDWGGFARGTTLVGAMAEVSSVNSALRPRVRGRHAGTSDLTHQIYPKNQLRQAARRRPCCIHRQTLLYERTPRFVRKPAGQALDLRLRSGARPPNRNH